MLPTVPHMRGDEPTSPVEVIAHWIPFPTCVGMNRASHWSNCCGFTVPHMRGDEPINVIVHTEGINRSPHAWG